MPDDHSLSATAPEKERRLNKSLRPLTVPSIDAWEMFWPLDGQQRVEMSKMLASFAAMVIVHHSHTFQPSASLPASEALTPQTDGELEYWSHAVDLVCDELEKLKPENLDERRMKMVAILRNAAFAYRRPSAAEAERDRLRLAIDPEGKLTGDLVPLAEAHRQDSEDRDHWEAERDRLTAELVEWKAIAVNAGKELGTERDCRVANQDRLRNALDQLLAWEATVGHLRQALKDLLAQSDDPNAMTGECDTAAGRARRALEVADVLASVRTDKSEPQG